MKSKQWEYRIEKVPRVTAKEDGAALKVVLDMLGWEGWELVTIDFDKDRAFFKREKEK